MELSIQKINSFTGVLPKFGNDEEIIDKNDNEKVFKLYGYDNKDQFFNNLK